jgi:hypothetical protein
MRDPDGGNRAEELRGDVGLPGGDLAAREVRPLD